MRYRLISDNLAYYNSTVVSTSVALGTDILELDSDGEGYCGRSCREGESGDLVA